jgi:hypothetical protein
MMRTVLPLSLLDAGTRLEAVLDRRRFDRARADYYEYLAAVVGATQGRRTVKDIFNADAARYGPDSVRGRLSRRWFIAYEACGGDLYATWLGSFPLTELNLVRAAQHLGNESLVRTLGELAGVLRLSREAARILVSTLWSAAVALCVLAAMLLAMPAFTVPRLRHTFRVVAPDYYGNLTTALFGLSDLVRDRWVLGLAFLAGVAALALWSLPNLRGPARAWAEKLALWRIYRHIHALQFFSTLGIVLGRDGATPTRLRTALRMQKAGASRWRCGHIDAMLARIDAGLVGAETFDTGLLDRDLYWFLCDTSLARGLSAGLALTRQRLELRVLREVAARAARLRWCLLLLAVAGLLGLGIWHYAVIDELRRSLMIFYASQ